MPEDRTGVGSAPNLSIADNLIMKRYRDAADRARLVHRRRRRARMAEELQDEYSIAAPSIDTEARLLSGGNLQRLILAREIERGPRLLVAVQPTRGLDVGAIETVHQRRCSTGARRARRSCSISEELDELLALSDRIVVMYEGRIVGSFDAPTTTDIDEIGLLMTGGGAASRRAGGSERERRSR